MLVKVKLLKKYMERNNLSSETLAQLMGISIGEVEKMLSGESIGRSTASLFIRYFTPEEAQDFIDWAAMGKENPLEAEIADDNNDSDGADFDGDGVENYESVINEDYWDADDDFYDNYADDDFADGDFYYEDYDRPEYQDAYENREST